MAKYLISFPSAAMVVPDDEWEVVDRDAHAVIGEAKAAGATPIVLSLTPRKRWQDGRIVRSGADSYGGWSRQVAAQEGVAFIDVNDLVASRYESLGAGKLDPLFGDPTLHTSKAGADLNAEIIAAELQKLPGLGEFAIAPGASGAKPKP